MSQIYRGRARHLRCSTRPKFVRARTGCLSNYRKEDDRRCYQDTYAFPYVVAHNCQCVNWDEYHDWNQY